MIQQLIHSGSAVQERGVGWADSWDLRCHPRYAIPTSESEPWHPIISVARFVPPAYFILKKQKIYVVSRDRSVVSPALSSEEYY